MNLQKPYIIALLALLCCALWGSAFPCIKIGYEWFDIQGAGSQILFAGWRFFLAGVMTFLFFSIKEKKPLTVQKRNIPAVIGQGFQQTTVQYFFFYLGLANTTATKGSVISAANVFFSVIIAHFIVKGEKITLKKAIGYIIGFAGVVAVNLTPEGFGSSFTLAGEGCVLLCAVAYGASNVTTKIISKRERPEAITAYQLMIGGSILIIIGYAAGGSMGAFTVKSALLLFYMSLLSMVAFTIWATLLKYNSVGKVTPYGFAVPVFGTALSAVFLGEAVFTWNNLVGLALVSVGILWVNVEFRACLICKN